MLARTDATAKPIVAGSFLPLAAKILSEIY
jgi:hypothetical protein